MRFKDLSDIREFLVPDVDSYTLGLSVASAVGFGLAVGGMTFLDSHYVNAVYGLRHYPLGYFVLIFCLPEFYLTYRFTSVKRSFVHVRNARLDLPVTRAIFAFVVPMIVALVLSPNFGPEFPHIGLMEYSFAAGAFSSAGTYLHNVRTVSDFSFVADKEMNETAKVEMLKLAHSTWSDSLKVIVAVYVAVVGVYVLNGYQGNLQAWQGNLTVAFWWTELGLGVMLFYTAFLIFAILTQLFGGMADIQDQLLNIRKGA